MKTKEIKNKQLRNFVSEKMNWIIRKGEIYKQDYEDIKTLFLSDNKYMYKIYTFNGNFIYVDIFNKFTKEHIITNKYKNKYELIEKEEI